MSGKEEEGPAAVAESFGTKWVAPPDGPPDEPGCICQETAVSKNWSALLEGAPPTALQMSSHTRYRHAQHWGEINCLLAFLLRFKVSDSGLYFKLTVV